MWVMRVERVQGDYKDPEIIDLEDGCLFKIHESDISEDGTKMLADLLTEQAQRWAPRPAGTKGPVIPVRWDCVPDLPDPFVIGVEEQPDGLRIIPAPLHGASIETYNDHRMAMSLALVGLRVPGIVIQNPGCVAKTYPGYFRDLQLLTT